MGFVFVDRITALDAESAHGQLDLVAGDPALPPWLILEAVGQLAAWIAMARTDFARRPVAALIGEAQLDDAAWCDRADGPVEMTARIERIDARAILYSGTARCGPRLIANLARCVGPLLPLAAFDDPDLVRRRLAMLRSGGSGVARGPLPRPALTDVVVAADGARSAQLAVPASAGYFADHFPLRPVFPASLLADALSELAAAGAAEALGVAAAQVRTIALHDLKVRAFAEPGQLLVLRTGPATVAGGVATVPIGCEMDGKRTASGQLAYRAVAP